MRVEKNDPLKLKKGLVEMFLMRFIKKHEEECEYMNTRLGWGRSYGYPKKILKSEVRDGE